MVNNSQFSSNNTRGMNIMNLRFWGGWFLAVACVCIFLTMGCGNGALGVKDSVVVGRVLDRSNRQPIQNVTVRMVSKESVGSGDLTQGYNFLSTKTDADGFFSFEKVNPDNVIFGFDAAGYASVVYPSSSDDEDGGESVDVESVSIKSGETVDIADILMTKISTTLPSTIKVKLEFVDSSTKERVDENESFVVTFDGVSHTMKAKAWRETGVENIISAETIAVTARNDSEPVLYESNSLTLNGTHDVYEVIELKPVTYSLSVEFANVPEYIKNTTLSHDMCFIVEDSSSVPAKFVASYSVNVEESAFLKIPAIKNPQRIRIKMRGYSDDPENADTPIVNLNFDSGNKGNYRIIVDFNADYDRSLASSDGIVGMNNIAIKRNVLLRFSGLKPHYKALALETNIPGSPDYPIWAAPGDGRANADGIIEATLQNVPCGYDFTYAVTICNTASNTTFIYQPEKAVNISMPTADEISTSKKFAISANLAKAAADAEK